MTVLVPFCTDTDLNALAPFSDKIELYGGFMDPEWASAFGSDYGLNRMSSFQRDANFCSFDEMLVAVDSAAAHGIRVSLVFNALHYDQEQSLFIKQHYFSRLSKNGLDTGVIVSCKELVRYASSMRLRTSVSTIAGVYNAQIAAMYQKEGADSVILPRELNLDEVSSIKHCVPILDYEVFLMSNGCRYSDAVCMGCHIPHKGGLCQQLDQSRCTIESRLPFEENNAQWMSSMCFHNMFMKDACGLCSLWRLCHIGVNKFKLVGRSAGFKTIFNTLQLILKNIDIAKSCDDEMTYLNHMIMPANQASRCTGGFNCYYPEVRFPQ